MSAQEVKHGDSSKANAFRPLYRWIASISLFILGMLSTKASSRHNPGSFDSVESMPLLIMGLALLGAAVGVHFRLRNGLVATALAPIAIPLLILVPFAAMLALAWFVTEAGTLLFRLLPPRLGSRP